VVYLGCMTKVQVIWVKTHELGNQAFTKGAGDPFLIIGEEGENIIMVMKPSRVLIPIFESSSTVSFEEVTQKILYRMEALAECSVVQTGEIGLILGVFRSSYQLMGEILTYVVDVGLGCTTGEFKVPEPHLTPEECKTLGLPYEVEIDLSQFAEQG
jgi:hypothetical protein